MLSLLLITVGLAGGDDSAALVSALEAGHEQWQNAVCFRASFRLRHGFAKSLQAGLQNGIDESLHPPAKGALADSPSETFVFDAKGKFIKKGRLFRISLDYGQNPVPVQAGSQASGELKRAAKAGSMLVNMSFDEVSNEHMLVRYEPGASGDIVHLERRQPSKYAAGPHSENVISPLNFFGNPRFRPLVLWDLGIDPKKSAVSTKINQLDKDHLEVVLSQDGNWRQLRKVRFWTSPSPPVITEIIERMTNPQGQILETDIRLKDFRECPGGMVARNVRLAYNDANGHVRVKDWASDDLGDQQPSDSDFVVHIAPTTAVAGFKDAPPATVNGDDRFIDINVLAEADVGTSVMKPRPETQRGSTWRTVALVNAFFIAGLAGLLFVRRFYRKTEPSIQRPTLEKTPDRNQESQAPRATTEHF